MSFYLHFMSDPCSYLYKSNAVLRTKIDFYLAFSKQHYRCNHSQFICFILKFVFLSVHTRTNYSTNLQLPQQRHFLFLLQFDLIVFCGTLKLFIVLVTLEFVWFLTWHRLLRTNTAMLRLHLFSCFYCGKDQHAAALVRLFFDSRAKD